MTTAINNLEHFIQRKKVRKVLIGFLCFCFIFLFQIFFYVTDFNILYIISKIVIGIIGSLVFFIYFIRILIKRKLPKYSWYLVLSFFALVLLSASTSNYYFHQPFLLGVIAQVKLNAIFYFFLVLAILKAYRVTLKELETTFIWLGIGFVVLYILINIFVNPIKYWTPYSSIVVHDSKGYRFRLPDVFVSIFTFYSFRKFLQQGKFWMLMGFLLSLAYILIFSKERAYMGCVGAVLGLVIFFRAHLVTKIALVSLGLVAIVWLSTGGWEDITSDVDTTSLDVRYTTSTVAYGFISSDIMHFVVGGGNLNELWDGGFERIYGQNFYLSDIGWVGVDYEFGLIGVLICLSLYFLIFYELNTFIKYNKLILILAFRDFVLMRFMLSVLSPAIPYFIGIFTSILAICVYLRLYLKSS